MKIVVFKITKDSILKETQVYLNLNDANQYYKDLILIHKKVICLGILSSRISYVYLIFMHQ